MDVDLAEEGVLWLIFAAVCLLFHKAGTDGDVSSALRQAFFRGSNIIFLLLSVPFFCVEVS